MPEEDDTDLELPKNLFEEPPTSGELWLSIDAPTPSLQGKKMARVLFEEKIHEVTRKYQYLFNGDISLDITCRSIRATATSPMPHPISIIFSSRCLILCPVLTASWSMTAKSGL